MKKKLLFNITEDWFFCSHFVDRALAAKRAGYSIFVISKMNNHKSYIENLGIKFLSVPFNRKSVNPIYEFYIFLRIIYFYLKIKPDIVHHIAAKPIIYGSIAAKICKIKSVINAPVGMGFVFSSDSFKAKMLKPLVKFFLKQFLDSHYGPKRRNKVIFENRDDLNYFIEIGALKPSNAIVIRGAGVKLQVISGKRNSKQIPIVALVARMLKDKGIYEFVEAARKLKNEKLNAKFLLVGDIDPLNPTSLDRKTLSAWQSENVIDWLGWVDDVGSILRETDILCLPSYREGLPKALIEGASYGIPLITTDAVGCREVVEDGVNGFLVPIKDVEELKNKISILINNKDLREKMGKESYKIASSKFASKKINAQTLKVYDELFF
ncbi:MAG: glycosyltransferase family 4 protein [Prochlorococcus marinus CUG1438]|nr:glycosyltransferase family 4 protein [Prochlorococcus marinus CUG1438]